MAIYRTATFVVRPAMLSTCKKAVAAFVSYVRRNEPRTRVYVSLQDREEPTRFLHVMVFEDQAAERRHRISPGYKRFLDLVTPLTNDGIRFADCDPVGPGIPPPKKADAGEKERSESTEADSE